MRRVDHMTNEQLEALKALEAAIKLAQQSELFSDEFWDLPEQTESFAARVHWLLTA